MNHEIKVSLTEAPIDLLAIHEQIREVDCGAQMVFVGSTRRLTGHRVTECLSYQAYHSMAENELRKLATQAAQRWSLAKVVIVHRLGKVEVGEASIAIGASSPHRPAVMSAIPWLMDSIKSEIPIWKQETFVDQSKLWIHPSNP